MEHDLGKEPMCKGYGDCNKRAKFVLLGSTQGVALACEDHLATVALQHPHCSVHPVRSKWYWNDGVPSAPVQR